MLKIVTALLFSTAFAQEPFVPIDEVLWQQMSQAFSNLSMPAQAHQQVQEIMKAVEARAKQQAREKTQGQATPKNQLTPVPGK